MELSVKVGCIISVFRWIVPVDGQVRKLYYISDNIVQFKDYRPEKKWLKVKRKAEINALE